MEMKRRILVVGLGSIGRRHVRLLKERPDVTVVCCEPNPEVLAAAEVQLEPLSNYANYETALATKPDAVVIATPHRLHADQTVAALDRGIHVLCEKPMSDNPSDARRMKAAADRSQAVFGVGFQLHFHPGARRLKELIDAGELGAILHFHCRVGSYITLLNSISRYQATLEGALLLDYAHQPDLLCWMLAQEPCGVFMCGAQGGDMQFSSSPNVLALTCEYDGPLISTVHLNYVQMPERHEYEVVGDRGWALCDMNGGLIRVGKRESKSERREIVSTERDPVYRAEHQAFFDAIDGKRKPESSAADGLISLRIIEAAIRSWKEGGKVPLAPAAHTDLRE